MKLAGISNVDWKILLPPTDQKPTILDSLPRDASFGNLLSDIQRIRDTSIKLKLGELFKDNQSVDYRRYLQFPNSSIKALALSIVSRFDSDDVKAWKLLRWVQENITYEDDLKTYGLDEFWALPTSTREYEQGDCEDGAFLLASLMLNAGVNANRVRVYGGFVSAGTNASTGGHAWVAYKRQADNQWVALDWCYFPTTAGINDRPTIEEDSKYWGYYFYITPFATVSAEFMNSLRAIVRTEMDECMIPIRQQKAIAAYTMQQNLFSS